jgi:predicted transcriptional regulator
MQAIEETPPPTSASKITLAAEVATSTEAAPTEATTVEATTDEATNLESTLSDIGRILLDMAAEEAAAAAEETLAIVPRKGKEIAEDISEEKRLQFSKQNWSRVI